MKRFYKDVSVAAEGEGHAIQLDGRPVKTPQRNALALPTLTLAEAVARERARIVSRIAAFADSDMLYYRADEGQQALIDHQTLHWDPLLDWARQRYDVSFHLVYGIRYKAQPAETLERLAEAVEAQDDFAIAAMLSLVGLSGSLIATLALVEQDYDSSTLWPLVNLEELWQEQQWGRDAQAVAARGIKQAEFEAAARFLDLSRR